MIPLSTLLEDPDYKEFFLKVPKLPAVVYSANQAPPWRLYVLLKGDKNWRRKDFPAYAPAFKHLKRLLKSGKVEDAAINCRRFTSPPPLQSIRVRGKYVVGSDGVRRQVVKRVEWKPRYTRDDFEDHTWCPYCRRPTVFRYYARHHAMADLGIAIDPSVQRCCICGASSRIANYRRPS